MQQDELLKHIVDIQNLYLEQSNNGTAFDTMLKHLLSITESEFGFIGEIIDENGTPYLKTYAVSNIAWSDETRAFYKTHAPEGLEFRKLDSIYGVTLQTGEHYITNNPSNDVHSYGLPKGHPKLKSYLGVALHSGGKFVGMAGLANRKDGYSEAFLEKLKPLFNSYATIVRAYIYEKLHIESEQKLEEVNQSLQKDLQICSHEFTYNNHLLDEYKHALDESMIVSKTDSKGIITYVNDRFSQLSGYSQEELLENRHNLLRHPDMPNVFYRDLWKSITSKKTWHGTIKNQSKLGNTYFVDTTIVPLINAKGDIKEYISIGSDVSHYFNQKEIIKKHTTDSLTSLPNRLKLIEHLRDKSSANKLLAILDIDRFNEINSYFGHNFGDEVILEISKRLHQRIDNDAELFKLPEDKFALLYSDTDMLASMIIYEIQSIAQDVSKEAVNISGDEIHFSFTIGCADGDNPLLPKATWSLKKAKSLNKGLYLYEYHPDEERKHTENLNRLKQIKSAIDNERIIVHYQPIMDNSTSKIVKYESLVRLLTKDGEILTPYHFLDIAKRAKIYPFITKAVINQAFENFRNTTYSFSVNLSIDDIMNKDTTDYIEAQIKEFPNPQRIIFELTESERMESSTHVSKFVEHIRAYGCKVAIDDFGTGYSNFEYLLQLNVDIIKIDGSLIKNIAINPELSIIVQTIASISKQLGMETIAEYVENNTIQTIVKDLGINYSQGYLIGKPAKFDNALCKNI